MTKTHAHGFASPPVAAAPYLDTQTLGGDDGYFHTQDDAQHVTDGTAHNGSPETPLVVASQGHPQQLSADGLDEMTKKDLEALADERGVDLPPRANKAEIVEALRA